LKIRDRFRASSIPNPFAPKLHPGPALFMLRR